MSRPVLWDLFCKAGGATRGYQEAGFHVIGVDIEPQPNFIGDEFIQADALEILRTRQLGFEGVAGVHASPPCQAYTAYRRAGNVGEHPDLVAETRDLLDQQSCLPYVIENVVGAPLIDPVLICGSMFDETMDIRRHRLFEANWDLQPPAWGCRHKLQAPDRFPGGRSKQRTGSSKGLVRATMEIGSWDIPLADQKRAMGIDWDVTLPELSNAIPPAYTRHVGAQLLSFLEAETNLEAAA